MSLFPTFSVMELVDAAIPAEELVRIKQTILNVEGVKVFRHKSAFANRVVLFNIICNNALLELFVVICRDATV